MIWNRARMTHGHQETWSIPTAVEKSYCLGRNQSIEGVRPKRKGSAYLLLTDNHTIQSRNQSSNLTHGTRHYGTWWEVAMVWRYDRGTTGTKSNFSSARQVPKYRAQRIIVMQKSHKSFRLIDRQRKLEYFYNLLKCEPDQRPRVTLLTPVRSGT